MKTKKTDQTTPPVRVRTAVRAGVLAADPTPPPPTGFRDGGCSGTAFKDGGCAGT